LCEKSEKKSGEQPVHQGLSLPFLSTPDEIVFQQVEWCEAYLHNLHVVAVYRRECHQVVNLPSPRLLAREYRAEQKQYPHRSHLSMAVFPAGVQAFIQYGPNVATIAVYLVTQQLLP